MSEQRCVHTSCFQQQFPHCLGQTEQMIQSGVFSFHIFCSHLATHISCSVFQHFCDFSAIDWLDLQSDFFLMSFCMDWSVFDLFIFLWSVCWWFSRLLSAWLLIGCFSEMAILLYGAIVSIMFRSLLLTMFLHICCPVDITPIFSTTESCYCMLAIPTMISFVYGILYLAFDICVLVCYIDCHMVRATQIQASALVNT